MRVTPPTWLQTVQTLLVALVGGGIWSVLQTLISGRQQRGKTEGEGKAASGAGTKSEAEAHAVDADARTREWLEINESIDRARQAAEKAAEKAQAEADRAREDAERARDTWKTFLIQALNGWDLLLDQVEVMLTAEDPVEREEAIRELRVMLRADRRAVWELRP